MLANLFTLPLKFRVLLEGRGLQVTISYRASKLSQCSTEGDSAGEKRPGNVRLTLDR
jgi:hypothetical protein